MYLIEDLLKKVNDRRTEQFIQYRSLSSTGITLPDIMVSSFSELHEIVGDSLTWDEINFLYQQAQKELKDNKMAESHIIGRSNPQLTNAVRLGIQQSSMLSTYNKLFPQRTSKFVKSDSVASMFSPASYLTTLYREARNLHNTSSQYYLDTRRPDLASLQLSQSTMNDELSTLFLSNELQLNNIQILEGKDYDEVLEMLSTYRHTGMTPYHQPYEVVRHSILLQDEELNGFWRNPDVAKQVDKSYLLSIHSDISPELYNILTESIEEGEVDNLIKKNFGESANVKNFQSITYLSRYYELTYDEMNTLLELFSVSGNADANTQYYINNQFGTLVRSDDDFLKAVTVIRASGENPDQLDYAELIPLMDGSYQFNYLFEKERKDTDLRIGTKGFASSDLFYSTDFTPLKNTAYSVKFKLDGNNIREGVEIGISRMTEGKGAYSSFYFTLTEYSFQSVLLKLNKFVRLYKAIRFPPSDIRAVIESNGASALTIDNEMLGKLFLVNNYMRQYNIDVSSALVLSGSNISQISQGSKPSSFTLLFNTPPLSHRLFLSDNYKIDLTPGKSDDSFRLAVLKRAFRVNDVELYIMRCMQTGNADSPEFICNVENLSSLYRVRVIADIYDLSITELALLLSLLPQFGDGLIHLSEENLTGLINEITLYTQWLKTQKISVNDLYLMANKNYSAEISPEIENLIATLNNGLRNQTAIPEDETELIHAVSPFIAAAMQLDSAETAQAILLWLDQLKPLNLNVAMFLELIGQDKRTDDDTARLFSFCQVLGQLTLIVRTLMLTSGEIYLFVTQPGRLISETSILSHDIATIRTLTRFHNWLQQCGASATEILSALSHSTLAPAQLARIMKLDEQFVIQGLRQYNTNLSGFTSWTDIDVTLQWLDMATTLGITPAGIALLVNLKFTDSAAYPDWLEISHAFQAGLTDTKNMQLQATLDELLSSALSAYTIMNNAPDWVTNRDELYNWLLIDNQVSSQVKTTRLAEAISSVQLYVNRALTGMEDGAEYPVISRAFFKEWEIYNKRYSTWSGVSQLVYYPENYIDPTLRVGQTGMMDEMLQTLSQSQLSSDTVESAFKTYLTRFEEIASLTIISGYHDNVSDKEGITYLIGLTDIGDYYWRSVDRGKMTEGKLPANAWTEWKKITVAVSAVNNLIRPVIFQSRLYLVWIEQRDVAETVTDISGTIKSTEYLLKYAHILYDKTWSSVTSVNIDTKTLPPESTSIDETGMYCAEVLEQHKLNIYFYHKQAGYSVVPDNTTGLIILTDGTVENISSSAATLTAGSILKQFDSTTELTLNTPYIEAGINASIKRDYMSAWGDRYYSTVFLTDLSGLDATLSVSESEVLLRFSAVGGVSYNGIPGDRSQKLVNMMASLSDSGARFYIPGGKSQSSYSTNREYDVECLTFSEQGVTTIILDVSENYINENGRTYTPYYAVNTSNPSAATRMTHLSGGRWFALIKEEITLGNLHICRSDPFPAAGSDFVFSDFKLIDTTINPENVIITVAEGGGEVCYADERIKYTLEDSRFTFSDKNVKVSVNIFNNNTAEITLKLTATAPDKRPLGSYTKVIALKIITGSSLPVISLHRLNSGVQYLQYGVYRFRVNTLFAKQLVARANAGLDSALSMETQQLQEPQRGEGVYVNLVLSAYTESIHGESGNFEIVMFDVFSENDSFILTGGTLDATRTVDVTLFLPGGQSDYKDIDRFYIRARYQAGETSGILITRKDDSSEWFVAPDYNNGTFDGLHSIVVLNNQHTEPMDFNGANALYFWEMFYYVPMMVFKRLLQENRFIEATQWIKYIWSPEGYLVNEQPATYQWNVRPLEEDTAWHADPLGTMDPDAVAQADPMHYKVATFMSWLDLLIARGDAVYRLLENDTLNEAKMWYVQALSILGDEPDSVLDTTWPNPRLSEAASEATQTSAEEALLAVRQQNTSYTASNLTGLFLPQQNEKLAGYWQILAQRLYNLRHNLSIDGQLLSLPIFATPADPMLLLSAAVNSVHGGIDLPAASMPLYRFPVILESAKSMVAQLSQTGSALLTITERQDAEALSELLQTQGSELVRQSIALQEKIINETDADRVALEASRRGAQLRLDSYSKLYDENVSAQENLAMGMRTGASVISATTKVLFMGAAAAEIVPNIYGMAVGGARYGALLNASAIGTQIASDAAQITADSISQSENWRRRREEWGIQRNAAESEVKQIDAQLAALVIRREAAVLQRSYLETQQSQTQAQFTFLQNKFTNKALYNWLRGKLSAIYYQFYDLVVSRCLMAQEAYKWTLGVDSASFIRPGAWQGTYGGMLAGEMLMLNLSQMEQAYIQKSQREKEISRTVCLSEIYAELSDETRFDLDSKVTELVSAGHGSAGTDENGIKVENRQLLFMLRLSDLNIMEDYPDTLGNIRRIKQISVTLPTLIGPYQDVRAVLSYGGSVVLPQGCNALAVSHGMNDSGQFQLDFNDNRWLPFEGIPVDDTGILSVSFPDADSKQQALLLSLTDIILHIHYTIIS